MAEEVVTIYSVKTGEAVKSIADLRDNVKELKKTLETTQVDTEEGWKTYQETLKELKVNQNALKDAMYATTGSFEDVTKAANGTATTYNSLVHQMADLKSQLRATDVSTESGKEKFRELAAQINKTNDTLKEMDALQGNFQRNVGNYPGLMKNWAGSVDALDKGFKSATTGLAGLKGGFEALSVSPAIAIIGIIASLISKTATSLKENETAMGALQSASISFEPILNFFRGVLEKVADILVIIVNKVTEFVNNNGLMPKIMNALAGVGNAIINFVVAPFKGVVEAIKVFKEKGIKGLGEAARAFGQEMKSGVAFKSNYDAGTMAVDGILEGAKSKKKDANDTGVEIGKEISKGIETGLMEIKDGWLDKMDVAIEARMKASQEAANVQKELDDMTMEDADAAQAYAEQVLGEIDAQIAESQRKTEELSKARIATMYEVANATSSILSSIADMYENDEENSEKNANKIKNLRIASATIDTISGAIGAYMQATETIPPPFGQIVGAAQAVAITAAGVAQISQMRNQKVSGEAGNSSPVSAYTPAPAIVSNVPSVRTVTSASEEDRLNYMAYDQKVALVMSELELKQGQRKVQVAEASF